MVILSVPGVRLALRCPRGVRRVAFPALAAAAATACWRVGARRTGDRIASVAEGAVVHGRTTAPDLPYTRGVDLPALRRQVVLVAAGQQLTGLQLLNLMLVVSGEAPVDLDPDTARSLAIAELARLGAEPLAEVLQRIECPALRPRSGHVDNVVSLAERRNGSKPA